MAMEEIRVLQERVETIHEEVKGHSIKDDASHEALNRQLVEVKLDVKELSVLVSGITEQTAEIKKMVSSLNESVVNNRINTASLTAKVAGISVITGPIAALAINALFNF